MTGVIKDQQRLMPPAILSVVNLDHHFFVFNPVEV